MTAAGKIVVVGGRGLVGAKLSFLLTVDGQEVLPASRSLGVDVITGDGLADALRGARVLVDVTDAPSYDDAALMDFFTTSADNLAAAERPAGVAHHVALSVVGADRMPESGYMRAKVAQESRIAGSGIPYTILRATQFFEFAWGIADSLTVDDTVRVPDALIQPIAAAEVAAKLAGIARGGPANAIVELGGPEYLRFEDFIRTALAHRGDGRAVVTDTQARYFGALLEQRTLVTDQAGGWIRFANSLPGS